MSLYLEDKRNNDSLKKYEPPKVDYTRLSSPVSTYSLPQDEIDKIFKNMKPQTPPSMIGVGILKRKPKAKSDKNT